MLTTNKCAIITFRFISSVGSTEKSSSSTSSSPTSFFLDKPFYNLFINRKWLEAAWFYSLLPFKLSKYNRIPSSKKIFSLHYSRNRKSWSTAFAIKPFKNSEGDIQLNLTDAQTKSKMAGLTWVREIHGFSGLRSSIMEECYVLLIRPFQ